MTIKEWKEDFESFVNELDMPKDDYNGIMEYIYDGYALLKEQEPIEPKIRHGNWWFQCGKCKAVIEYGDKFCKECGQEAKWK